LTTTRTGSRQLETGSFDRSPGDAGVVIGVMMDRPPTRARLLAGARSGGDKGGVHIDLRIC